MLSYAFLINLFQKNFHKYSTINQYLKKGLRTIDDVWVRSVKKSNRLYIMGSGPSINNLSDDDWYLIKSHDSVGFNYWWLHKFVPTFYVAQDHIPGNSKPYKLDLMNKSFQIRRNDYTNTPIVFRGWVLNNRKLSSNSLFNALQLSNGSNLVISGEFSLNMILHNSESKSEFKLFLYLLRYFGWLRKGKLTKLIPKFSSTVSYIMALGCQMGYDEIILCGIDMNKTGHFFDRYDDSISRMLRTSEKKRQTHPHFLPKSQNGLSVKNGLIALSEILETEGVKVYIQSSVSSLYPDIGVIE